MRDLLFSHLAVNLNIISFVRRSGSFVCFFHLTAIDRITYFDVCCRCIFGAFFHEYMAICGQ